MEPKEEIAIGLFRSGLNCAQAVLTSYAEKLNFDEDLALGVSSGFGGGMGRLQEKCGAVTGAFMVIGIYNSKKHKDNSTIKEESYAMVQKFNEKFVSLNGTTECRSLIKCDITTAEGRQFAKENKIFDIVCEKCIVDTIRIIEDLIK